MEIFFTIFILITRSDSTITQLLPYPLSADKSQTYSWQEFEEKVIGEKLSFIKSFISTDDDKGNSFLYKLLEYLRGILGGEKINIARAAYLLSRMCTEMGKENKKQKEEFSEKVFGWISSGSKSDIQQLITAISIFVYKERGSKENG